MFDVTVRGWILILAGIAMALYAGRRDRGFGSREAWVPRLIGMGLMLQGGAFHFEHFGITDFAWLPWVAFVILALGVVLAVIGAFRNRVV